MQLDIIPQIPVGQVVAGACFAIGEQYSIELVYIRVTLLHKRNRGCVVQWYNSIEKLPNLQQYRNNFTIMCTTSTKDMKIGLKCHTHNEIVKTHIEVVDPKVISPPLSAAGGQPIEAIRIISKADDIKADRGMPASINCTVYGNQSDYKLAWIKGQKFVSIGEQCTVWTSQFDTNTNTQCFHLIVYSVEEAETYTCVVINPAGKILDSQEQHIEVDKDLKGQSTLIKYLKNFFYWNWQHSD